MAKKLFGLSMFLWILIALVILFFVYGVGRREGFFTCSDKRTSGGCTIEGCTWNPSSCSNNTNYNSYPNKCKKYGGTYTNAYCS